MKPKNASQFNHWFFKHPYLISVIAFTIVFSLAALIAKKDYTLYKEHEAQKTTQVLEVVENNINQVLKNSYMGTLTLALTIDNNGEPKNFEEVSKKILNNNKSLDGLELVPNGVIKYVYPYGIHKEAIGLNIFEYEYSRPEALIAKNNGNFYFAGPLDFIQGGEGIIGRLPIYIENNFWGFSAVLINLDTFFENSGLKDLSEKGIIYNFTKINPANGKREYFGETLIKLKLEDAKKIKIEDADWEIYASPMPNNKALIAALPFLVFGFFLALVFAVLTYLILKKPAQLQKQIQLQAQKLLQSEIKYKAIFQEAGLGIVHLDKNERFLEVNPKFLQKTGYSQKELSTKKLSEIIIPKDTETAPLSLTKFEASLVCKNNSEIIINIINSTFVQHNKPTHILFVEDITDKKNAQNQLRNLRRRMEMAIRISKLCYWEWNPYTDKITMSDRLYSLFGFNEAETLSTEKILSRIHPEDLIEYKTTIEEILSTKGGSTLEIRLQNQTKVSHILARVECDIAENGKIALVKGTVLDITEKKEAMINLQHSYQMVMEQNERLLNFSYIISHNLRSHSSNIQGILEHIKEVKSEEETREMFNLLEEVATSLNTNLQDLNEVVHIHKSTKGEAQELNLCEFITKSKTILKRDLKKHQLNIIQKVPEEASVWFNPAYLESILLNIISYAIKHRDVKKNSKIKLTFREDKNYKILQIEDNGIGIDLDTDKKHIFGMYKTFKDFKESKSISLFVNNNQMQAMGGKIEVKSNINEGSEFHLYFKK